MLGLFDKTCFAKPNLETLTFRPISDASVLSLPRDVMLRGCNSLHTYYLLYAIFVGSGCVVRFAVLDFRLNILLYSKSSQLDRTMS